MSKVLNKVKDLILYNLKKIANGIPVAVILLFVYFQCTKIGSRLLMETPDLKWHVSDTTATKMDLMMVFNRVNSLLKSKNVDTKGLNTTLILCESKEEFKWKSFAFDDKIQAGTRNLFGYIVINKNSIKGDSMVGFDNSALSQVIAHELCHMFLSRRLSTLNYLFLKSWKNEGFCEYVASHSTLDLCKGVSWFLVEDKSELEKYEDYDETLYFYFSSRMKADYLLDHKRVPLIEFINTSYDVEALEREMREALKSGEYEFLP